MRLRSAALVLLLAAPVAAAPLDPQPKTPYRWRVFVSAAAHPTITPAVREQLVRDLKVALQDDLGEALGRVEVFDLAAIPADKQEPITAAFAQSGFAALDREEFRKLSGVKTHVLQLEFKDGQFRLSARQHDGDSGLASPLVRTKSTPDAGKIGRIAGQLVTRDFGLTATVEKVPGDGNNVKARFRGGELAGFSNHVKVGDVLAFSTIREQIRPPAKDAKLPRPGQPIPVALDLVAQPRDFQFVLLTEVGPGGEFSGRLLTRWAQPFPTGRNVAGYRALKLATADAPLTVRLADDKGGAHPPDFRPQVWAGDGAFTANPTERESFRGTDGVYQSLKPVKGLACVSIRIGNGKLQGFPVPVLGGGTPALLKFNIDEKEIARADFEQQCEGALRKAGDVLLAQTELFRGLGPLISAGDFKAALERATKGLKAVTDSDTELTDELGKLAANPLAKEGIAARMLEVSRDQLKVFRASKPDLEKKIDDLKQAIARADDPVRFEREFKANELSRQAKEFAARGEVPEAAAVYEQLFELTKQDDVKAKKDKLLQEWAPKSDEHKAARQFLLDEWRKAAELPELAALAPKLPATVDTFAANADRLGLLNLRGSIQAAGARLKDILDVLDAGSETDAAKIQDVKAVDKALAAADAKALDALEKLEPKK